MSLTTKRPTTQPQPDLPFHDVLDYLIRNWRGPATEYCAYEILTAISQLGLCELQKTLMQLSTEQVLQHKWTIEGRSDRFNVSEGDLYEVLATNEYRHPATGEVVVDAALKIVLCYQSGPALNQLMLFSDRTG